MTGLCWFVQILTDRMPFMSSYLETDPDDLIWAGCHAGGYCMVLSIMTRGTGTFELH